MVIAVFDTASQLFRWNLSANVGRGQPNLIADVELVRLGYVAVRDNTKFPDGYVSVAKISATSTNRDFYDGSHAWIIIILDNNLRDLPGDQYPRIDKHPKCGPELKKKVLKTFII